MAQTGCRVTIFPPLSQDTLGTLCPGVPQCLTLGSPHARMAGNACLRHLEMASSRAGQIGRSQRADAMRLRTAASHNIARKSSVPRTQQRQSRLLPPRSPCPPPPHRNTSPETPSLFLAFYLSCSTSDELVFHSYSVFPITLVRHRPRSLLRLMLQ